MTKLQQKIAADARAPYAQKILELENEIRLLRAVARALGASDLALEETRYKKEEK